MSTAQIKITTDRECDHCGYNLKGLPIEGKCPECGAPIRRLSLRTSGTMTDEAPTRFVRKLRMGFAFASAAIVGSLFVEIFSLYPLLNIPLSCLWVAGIFIITSKRPGKGHIRPDKVLDNDRLRRYSPSRATPPGAASAPSTPWRSSARLSRSPRGSA